jgi:hypothetical protein
VRFAELCSRVLGYERSKQVFYQPNPDKPGPWLKSKIDETGTQVFVDDYLSFRDSLLAVEEDVRIYAIEGHSTRIVVKETYAQILDELRRLRLELDDTSLSAEARKKLDAHPFGKRALPEDFVPSMDALPHSQYFQRFVLQNEDNVEDQWVRQKKSGYNRDFISSAAVDPNGDLLFFNRNVEPVYLRTDLFHEWAHRLAAQYRKSETAFFNAVLLEQRAKGWYFPSPYALTDKGEHWAVYGECMLAPANELAPQGALPENRKYFHEVCEASPLRAVIWMRTLHTLLKSAELRRGTMHRELLWRCIYTEKLYLKRAIELAESFLTSDDPKAVEQAQAVLDYLLPPQAQAQAA